MEQVLVGFLALVAIFAVGLKFLVGRRLKEVKKYVAGTREVEVLKRPFLAFTPKGRPIRAGFVFYPGGFIDAQAYGRIAAYLARHGILTVIGSPWLRLAWLDMKLANRVMEAFPGVTGWFVGGHSLGGVVAAFYLRGEGEKVDNGTIKGMVLMGTFMPEKQKLTNMALPVLSMYGSRDGMADRFDSTRYNISPNTTLHRIEGGNHGQFGYYGKHVMGDGSATISREEQQSIAEERALEFMDRVLETT